MPRLMRGPILLTAIALGAGFAMARDTDVTVNDLIGIVRQALQESQTDAQIAKALSKVKLAEQLQQFVLDQLESEGAGPDALLELDRLMEESARKPKPTEPTPFTTPAQPSREEMQAQIHETGLYGLNYAHSLPDFLCTQFVKRYQKAAGFTAWSLRDTLKLHLGYSGESEQYKLVEINGRPTKADYQTVGGAISEGEFGSMMYVLFDPRSHTRLFWDHWTRVRGRAVQVYSFTIAAKDSTYELHYGGMNARSRDAARAGASGLIYIDPETHAIVRLRRRATELPATFPIRAASTVLDYDYGEVGGKRFFLPVHATIRMETRELQTRNEVDFREYRKFQGESTISFGDEAEPAKQDAAGAPIKH